MKVLQFAWVSTIQVGMRTWCDGPSTYLNRIDSSAQLKLEQKFVNTSLYYGVFALPFPLPRSPPPQIS
jgi:hypothetical protein